MTMKQIKVADESNQLDLLKICEWYGFFQYLDVQWEIQVVF